MIAPDLKRGGYSYGSAGASIASETPVTGTR
jgi:hypothetical protein